MYNTAMNNINIINLSEMGLEGANLVGFLNEALYTDCHSWLLVKDGNKYIAYEVEREFTPKFDGYYCYNNSDQRYAPLSLTGYSFEVKQRKDETWGRWIVDTWIGEPLKTPTGKTKKKWIGLGKLHNYCAKFHDYNF